MRPAALPASGPGADGAGRRPPALLARGLEVRAGGRRLLDGVDVELHPGELVGLVGPNGAGKTTLLRVLAGLLEPDAGSVELFGRPVASYAPRARARLLAYVPQALAMEIDFRALEVALMGRHPHLRRWQPEGPRDLALARRALESLEIADRGLAPVSTLSAGERQRLVLARARCQEPRLALCDEPTANLDLRHRAIAFRLLRCFARRGGAALAALHDLDLAAEHCDRLLLLDGGALVASGRPAAVLTTATVRRVFGVEVRVAADPAGRGLRLTVLRPVRRGRRPPGQARGEDAEGGLPAAATPPG